MQGLSSLKLEEVVSVDLCKMDTKMLQKRKCGYFYDKMKVEHTINFN